MPSLLQVRMDEDFQSTSIQNQCISEDFTQIQTVVHSSAADYDLPVFAPSFDTAEGGYIVTHPADLKTDRTQSNSHTTEKTFLEEDSIIDIQLYESLQNHHNYSLKPAPTHTGDVKPSRTSCVTRGEFGLDGCQLDSSTMPVDEDEEDPSLDISDPLKEMCRSSSPFYVPPKSKGNTSSENTIISSSINTSLQTRAPEDTRQGDTLLYLVSNDADKTKRNTDTSGDKDKLDERVNSNTFVTLSRKADPDIDSFVDDIGQDKTMFSENLGLIPKDSEHKSVLDKPVERKGVQTRRSLVLSALKQLDDSGPVGGHKHLPGLYRCGSCSKTFLTICKLHQHLQDHTSGGSYYFNHGLKTAFPKFDTVCAYTQTRENRLSPKLKPFGKGIRLKAKFKQQSDDDEEFVDKEPTIAKKRKRGRPPKSQQKQTVVSRLKLVKPNIRSTRKEARDVSQEDKRTGQGSEGGSDQLTLYPDKQDEVYEISSNVDNQQYEMTVIEVEKDELSPCKVDIDKGAGKSSKRKMSTPRKILLEDVKCPVKVKCDFCKSEFLHMRGLLRHEREKHTPEMKFECDICKQKFMREYNLERHKLCAHTDGKAKMKSVVKKKRGRKPPVKTSEENYACDICGQLIPESRSETHARIHTGG